MSESQARQGASETLIVAIVAIVGLVILAAVGIVCGRVTEGFLMVVVGLIGTLAGAGAGAALVYGKARDVLQKERKDQTQCRQ